jgi:predicted PurR-regulated permease PerM
MNKYPPVLRLLIILLLIISLIFVLVIARDFLVPIFLASVFALLLLPLAEKLEKIGIPRILTNLILIILVLAAIITIVFFISRLMLQFVADIPLLKQQIHDRIHSVQLLMESKTGVSVDQQDIWWHNLSNNLFEKSGIRLATLFNATTGTIVKFGLLPVYIFLFLYYRNKFKNFLHQVAPRKASYNTDKIIDEISEVTPKYLRGLLIVVGLLVIINSVGFWIVGLQQPIFFGIIAALFNLIPVLGTIFGFLVALIFALLTHSSGTVIGIIILFIIVQFTENNILTPNITGSQVSINPMIIIMGIFAGGMIWGLAGMFVVIPALGMFKIMCENVESLKPYSFLMGTKGTEKYALTYNGIKKWLSRKLGLKHSEKNPM